MKTKGPPREGRPAPRKKRPPLLLMVAASRPEYEEALKATGYRVMTVPNMKDVFTLGVRPDVVIAEMLVPDGDLASLSRDRGRRRTRAMAVIALAGEDSKDAVVKAGATFCRFPCPPQELVELVGSVLARRER